MNLLNSRIYAKDFASS